KFRVKNYKWAASRFVVEGRQNGKRSRRFFVTKVEAQAYADQKNIELKNKGREHAEFDSRLRVMAQDCSDRLKAFGKTIADATNYFVAHLEASARSCSATRLVAEFLAAKKADGAGIRHLNDLKSRLGVFAKKFDGKMVSTITSKEIDEWLRS